MGLYFIQLTKAAERLRQCLEKELRIVRMHNRMARMMKGEEVTSSAEYKVNDIQ
jgi:hypothetical protein